MKRTHKMNYRTNAKDIIRYEFLINDELKRNMIKNLSGQKKNLITFEISHFQRSRHLSRLHNHLLDEMQ